MVYDEHLTCGVTSTPCYYCVDYHYLGSEDVNEVLLSVVKYMATQ